MYKGMRNLGNIFLALVVMAGSSSAQVVPNTASDGGGKGMCERDKVKEEQIAKLFETIRADAKLPPLSRIRHRDSLEQKLCTFGVSGTLRKLTISPDISAVYTTLKPETASSELTHIALFHYPNPKVLTGVERYSVAVWKVKNSRTGETTYWVGVQLYWSAAAEFFDSYFTDDLYYRNDWKKSIAPECRGK
jgi:hypothetical protein